MNPIADHDGKSQTSSAVDSTRYADPAEEIAVVEPIKAAATVEEIRARAHELWVKRLEPASTPEDFLLVAEAELGSAAKANSALQDNNERSGSVQR
jgi:hypothetical protein